MKSIVIYKSKSGFTKKYAEWIAEELAADIFHSSKVSIDMLKDYDTVIYGGGLYAVGINGVKLIKDNLDMLKGKKIVVFATGASPAREEALTEVREKNFTTEQLKYIRFFYLRGGFDYSKLTVVDKILMLLLKWKLRRTKVKTADVKGLLNAYNQPVDFAKKKNIEELVSFVRE